MGWGETERGPDRYCADSQVSGSSSVKADLRGSALGLRRNCSDNVLPRPDLGQGFFQARFLTTSSVCSLITHEG